MFEFRCWPSIMDRVVYPIRYYFSVSVSRKLQQRFAIAFLQCQEIFLIDKRLYKNHRNVWKSGPVSLAMINAVRVSSTFPSLCTLTILTLISTNVKPILKWHFLLTVNFVTDTQTYLQYVHCILFEYTNQHLYSNDKVKPRHCCFITVFSDEIYERRRQKWLRLVWRQ